MKEKCQICKDEFDESELKNVNDFDCSVPPVFVCSRCMCVMGHAMHDEMDMFVKEAMERVLKKVKFTVE